MDLSFETPLFLDHLTLVDQSPLGVIEAAHRLGYSGVCLFLAQMPELPRMPPFDLVANRQERRAVRDALAATGQRLGLAYPFTLSARSQLDAFQPSLECAAELGSEAVNVLIYDRDPQRRVDALAAFSALARTHGLRVAVEFYPASQVKTLAEACALVQTIDQPGQLGLNLDLLHLMRSGGSIADVAALPDDMVFIAQLADGPAQRPESEWAIEASEARAMMGAGDFDGCGFVSALPPRCRLSLEVPQPLSARRVLPLAKDVIALLLPEGRA